jgi:hypothetical protein
VYQTNYEKYNFFHFKVNFLSESIEKIFYLAWNHHLKKNWEDISFTYQYKKSALLLPTICGIYETGLVQQTVKDIPDERYI